MKNLYTFLFAASLSTVSLNAQVVIPDIQPEFGDQFVIKQNNAEMDPGPSGANVSWDYSDMSTAYTANYLITQPETVEGAEFFPLSTMAWIGSIEGLGDINGFYAYQNNTMIDYGTYSNVGGQIITNTNTEPLWLYQYPMNYLDEFSHNYSGTTELADILSTDFTGTYEYLVDAYGSISTPFGTFENALRLKVIHDKTSGEFVVTQDNMLEYYWFVPEYPVPVMVISSTDLYFMGEYDGTEYSNTYLSEYSFASGIAEKHLPPLKLFPNPSQSQINILSDFEGQAQLHIYTIDGKKVAQHNIRNNSKVDVSALLPGYYIAEVKQDGNTYTKASFAITH